MASIAYLTPDLPRQLTVADARKLCHRKRFRVGPRTFICVDTEQHVYFDGKITVFHDQQDSTAWAARRGKVTTAFYWTPERAVKELLEASDV